MIKKLFEPYGPNSFNHFKTNLNTWEMKTVFRQNLLQLLVLFLADEEIFIVLFVVDDITAVASKAKGLTIDDNGDIFTETASRQIGMKGLFAENTDQRSNILGSHFLLNIRFSVNKSGSSFAAVIDPYGRTTAKKDRKR